MFRVEFYPNDDRAGWRVFRKCEFRFCDRNMGKIVDQEHFPDANRISHGRTMLSRSARPLALLWKCHMPTTDFMMGVSMGDVINLRRFKKRTEKEQSAKQAEVNRARFGRTKPERTLDQQRSSRASKLLDQHRIDGEDAS